VGRCGLVHGHVNVLWKVGVEMGDVALWLCSAVANARPNIDKLRLQSLSCSPSMFVLVGAFA
jgi:hypothetical protein